MAFEQEGGEHTVTSAAPCFEREGEAQTAKWTVRTSKQEGQGQEGAARLTVPG